MFDGINIIDALKIGGGLFAIVLSIISLVVLFSKRYTAKDMSFTKTTQELTSHFMQFIERKDNQSAMANAEFIAAIRLIQQELNQKNIVILELSEQVSKQTEEVKKQSYNMERLNDNIIMTLMQLKSMIAEDKALLAEVILTLSKIYKSSN